MNQSMGMKFADEGIRSQAIDPTDQAVGGVVSSFANPESPRQVKTAKTQKTKTTLTLALWGARNFKENFEAINHLSERGEELKGIGLYVMTMRGVKAEGQDKFLQRASQLFAEVKVYETPNHNGKTILPSALFLFSGYLKEQTQNPYVFYTVSIPIGRSIAKRIYDEYATALSQRKKFLISRSEAGNIRPSFVAPLYWAFDANLPLFQGYGNGIENPPLKYLAPEILPVAADSLFIAESSHHHQLAIQMPSTVDKPQESEPVQIEDTAIYHAGWNKAMEEAAPRIKALEDEVRGLKDQTQELLAQLTDIDPIPEEVASTVDNEIKSIRGIGEKFTEVHDILTGEQIVQKITEHGIEWMEEPKFSLGIITYISNTDAALRLMAKAFADYKKTMAAATKG